MPIKTLFIGEAWGADEQLIQHPFVGPSGQELYRMLGQAGFPCSHLPYKYITPLAMSRKWDSFPFPLLNVFNTRPPDPEGKNRVEFFYAKLSAAVPIDRKLPRRKFGSSNTWVRAEFAHHVAELHANLTKLRPNLIVALGATACWALGLGTGIGALRGSVVETQWGKCLPIYHPALVLRKWENRVVTILDFHKARREAEFPEIRTKSREIWTEPTIEDLWKWWDLYGSKSELIAFDIETIRKKQISEIGFAADPTHALHIPFVIDDKAASTCKRYWPDTETELQAWKFVRSVCECPTPKIGQNVIQYDLYWMLKVFGIKVHNITEDTMTKAHCWQPELDKNLGFLGSIFLDERTWKSIRKDVGKEND